VLSVAKLALGQEVYYEQQVALGLDDYYAGRGESPGLWIGSGAEAIELVGAVEEGALIILLSGSSPADGERLRAPWLRSWSPNRGTPVALQARSRSVRNGA
jgi:hypothetical protein